MINVLYEEMRRIFKTCYGEHRGCAAVVKCMTSRCNCDKASDKEWDKFWRKSQPYIEAYVDGVVEERIRAFRPPSLGTIVEGVDDKGVKYTHIY